MQLVDVSQLPTLAEIQDVPLDDPLKIYKICQEMSEVCERENGIGLSAVQVGLPLKLFIVKSDGTCPLLADIEKGQYAYFVNCYYKPTDEERVVSLEGCLSIRSQDGQLRFFQVARHKTVRIEGQCLSHDRDLKFVRIDAEVSIVEQGIVFQHEADHHSAVLISDTGKEIIIW